MVGLPTPLLCGVAGPSVVPEGTLPVEEMLAVDAIVAQRDSAVGSLSPQSRTLGIGVEAAGRV
jgi:hypothetical protein